MSTQLDQPIEALLGGKRPRKFRTFEEVESWAKTETEAWKAFREFAQKKGTPFIEFIDAQIRVPDGIRAVAAGVANGEAPGGKRDKIQQELAQYGRGELIPSGSPEGKHVLRIASDNPFLATTTLMGLRRAGLDPRSPPIASHFQMILEGYTEAFVFRRGLKTDLSAERDALETLHSDFTKELNRASELTAKAESDRAAASASMDSYRQTQEERLQGLANNIQERIAKIEQTYKEAIRLRAPVDYWTQKRAGHRKMLVGAAGVFLVIVAAVLTAIACSETSVLSFLKGTDHGISLPSVLVGGIVAFLVLWVLRLVSRIFLANLTLNTDAAERVAMTQTFLALIEDGKITEEERILILQALFRSSALPTSQDDGAPPHWLSTILDRLTKAT